MILLGYIREHQRADVAAALAAYGCVRFKHAGRRLLKVWASDLRARGAYESWARRKSKGRDRQMQLQL